MSEDNGFASAMNSLLGNILGDQSAQKGKKQLAYKDKAGKTIIVDDTPEHRLAIEKTGGYIIYD